jgi:hypothetical protein
MMGQRVWRRVVFWSRSMISSTFSSRTSLRDDSDELTFRNIEIHLGLKQGMALITPGIRLQFNQLVGTHYLGHDENMAHREQFRDTVRAWGVDILGLDSWHPVHYWH